MSSYHALLEKIASNWKLLGRIPPDKINEGMALKALENSIEPYAQGLIPKHLLNSEFLTKALIINPKLFRHIDPSLMSKELIAEGLRIDSRNICYVPEGMLDEETASTAVFDIEMLRRLPERYITDFACIQAIITDPMNLEAIPWGRITYEVAFEAVQRNGLALEFVPSAIRDHELIRTAVTSNPMAIKHVPLGKQYPEIAELAVAGDPSSIRWVAEPLRSESLWLSAIDQDPNYLGMVSIHAQTRTMIESAIRQKPEAIVYSNPDYVTGRIADIVSDKAPQLVSHVPHELQTREYLRDYLIEDPTRIGWLNNQSLLSKVDLVQWLSTVTVGDKIQAAVVDRIPEFREQIVALVPQNEDIEHLKAAMDPEIDTTLKILNLAQIRPFNYMYVGKMCVELNAEKLLRDLFGGKVYERFFKKRYSPASFEV